MRHRVLVIDDKPSMARLLKDVLGLEHEVETFTDPRAALRALTERPADVVLTDVRMPGIDGMEVLRRVKAASPATEVILITAFGTVEQAVEATKAGAFNYVLKPFEPEAISVAVAKALEHRRLTRKATRLERELHARWGFERLVGESEAIRSVRALVEKVAPSDLTVLVEGESGTGKELVARALHEKSPRASGPFVVVHCAALPRDLIESELFGHVRGAFSGASEGRPGMVEEAEGGTLFLDDVNYLDLGLQAKVNRLVAEREVRPVGADGWRRADVRIVASTNTDLRAAAERGEFREDLYFRLAVFTIRMPALEERREDIPLLAEHFLQKHGPRLRKPGVRLGPAALDCLCRARWRGNVRELENAIERALIVCEGPEITVEDLPGPGGNAAVPGAPGPAVAAAAGPRAPSGQPLSEAAPPADAWASVLSISYGEAIERAREAAARAYLCGVLAYCKGNVTRAAEHAGVARQHFHRLLRKYGLAAEEVRAAPPERPTP